MRGLFFGLTTVDLQFLVENYPDANSKVKAKKNGIYAGGPATNAAIACAYLGGTAKLFTVIGQHPLREFIINDIQEAEVTVVDLMPDVKTEPVFASVITSEIEGSRTIFSYHPSINFIMLDKQSLTNEHIDIALFDGFYLDAANELAKNMKKHDIPVVLDGGSWKSGMEYFLPLVDIAICSEDFYPPNTSTTKGVMRYLKDRNISNIAITRGDKPLLFESQDRSGEIYIDKKQVVDTLGAGDFFHGAFCFYMASGDDFVEALRKSAELATQSCMEFGTRTWMKL
jgi:sugar/nucleoside kinase (ribokinase family)